MSAALAVPSLFVERRGRTADRLRQIEDAFEVVELAERGGHEVTGHPDVTLYASGSLGRHEMASRSDLDVFIVDSAGADHRLTNLDSIVLRGKLIRAAASAGFGRFSRDGEYLIVHQLSDLLAFLGTREDDGTNVFTARMLLLLESQPLAGRQAYERCVEATIEVYSRDAHDATAFRPTFLVNDLVRYWKTLCLNYEAKRHGYHRAQRNRDERAQALRVDLRLDLLKLRFNRLWTCFNGLAYLLAGVEDGKVTRDHVRRLVELPPVARVEELAERVTDTREPLARALGAYSTFLTSTDDDPGAVRERIADDQTYTDLRAAGERFGDDLDVVVATVAERAGLRRYLLL